MTGQFPVFQFRAGEQCLIARHDQNVMGRTFLHLVCYEEGAGAAVVETMQSASVSEVLPPSSREYIRLQMFLICSDDHLIFVGHNSVARDRTVQTALNSMIESFAGYSEAPAFHLEARLNDQKFNHILQNGIEEIDLNAGGFRQSMEYLRDQGQIKSGGIVGFLQSIVPEAGGDEAADDVVLRMKLKPRARRWDKPAVKALLGEIASNVIKEDDDEDPSEGFAIVTKSGLTITHDELRVRE